jgi:alpha-mannosidase
MKKDSRTAEATLVTAEKRAAVGSLAWGCRYPSNDLRTAWKRAIYQHVHDSINGVSLPSHYETTGRDAFGYALDVGRRALYMSAQKLAWDVPTEDPKSQYLFIFNPHAWPLTTHVSYQLLNVEPETRIRVEDERGNRLLHQWTQRTAHAYSHIRKLVARVTLPAFGYRQIRIREDTAPLSQALRVHASSNSLENERLRVTFAKNGVIGILDKTTGRQVFQGGTTGARALPSERKSPASVGSTSAGSGGITPTASP